MSSGVESCDGVKEYRHLDPTQIHWSHAHYLANDSEMYARDVTSLSL